MNNNSNSLAKLLPMMLCFFAMGFVDLVGIASNYVKADLNLTDSQANTLKDTFQVVSSPSNVVQALFLNNAEKPLDDVRVRQAICYALDKDMINEFVAGGNGTPVSSAMLPTLKDYYVDLNDMYGSTANIDKAKELHHGKQSLIYHKGNSIFTDIDSPIKVARYHSLSVLKEGLPDCLEVLAETDDGEIMAMRHREYPLVGMQFHPESIYTQHGKRMIENFLRGVI